MSENKSELIRLRNPDISGFLVILEEGFGLKPGKPIKVAVRLRKGLEFQPCTPRNANLLYDLLADQENKVFYRVIDKKPIIYVKRPDSLVTRIMLDY